VAPYASLSAYIFHEIFEKVVMSLLVRKPASRFYLNNANSCQIICRFLQWNVKETMIVTATKLWNSGQIELIELYQLHVVVARAWLLAF
jgi:hypothetical protein